MGIINKEAPGHHAILQGLRALKGDIIIIVHCVGRCVWVPRTWARVAVPAEKWRQAQIKCSAFSNNKGVWRTKRERKWGYYFRVRYETKMGWRMLTLSEVRSCCSSVFMVRLSVCIRLQASAGDGNSHVEYVIPNEEKQIMIHLKFCVSGLRKEGNI